MFRKEHYRLVVDPSFRGLKFKYFGHDAVILYGNRIRRREPRFGFVANPSSRPAFLSDMADALVTAEFAIIAAAIDKRPFAGRSQPKLDPYHVALGYCMEQTWEHLRSLNQDIRTTHVVMEGRSLRQNAALSTAFHRIRNGRARWNSMVGLDLVLASKRLNITGLQIADLTAQPVGKRVTTPSRPNRAWGIISRKLLKPPKILREELELQALMAGP